MWAAMVRGPLVYDERGQRRALVRPRLAEFVTALILTAIAMIVLYAALDGRNQKLLERGATFFSPHTSWDDHIALMPGFVVAYYSYFRCSSFSR